MCPDTPQDFKLSFRLAYASAQLWTEMVSTSLRKLELPDYVAFCEARGLPREWLGKDGSVEHMKFENVLHLATEIEALGSSCTPLQVLSDFESKFSDSVNIQGWE